ncbi:MAG: hypothetical protein C5B54_00615 [Acidobacteria bacterium]|nr:MAG: hypothetical protein C5B54_00615 [Acidobacteriota bacterium]
MITVSGAAISSPILLYSSQFYPEILAFLLIVLTLRQLQDLDSHPQRSGILLALFSPALLWLHPKYLMLSLLIMAYAAFRLRKQRAILSAQVLISVIGLLCWFVFLHSEYGSWSPNRIYGGWQKQTSFIELIQEEGFERVWIMLRMMIGFWIDQRFGIVPYAPFYAAFFSALVYFILRVQSSLKIPILILFFSHYLALSWGAPLGGYSPPSRHIVVLLPFVLLCLSSLVPQWKTYQKYFFYGLVLISGLVSALILTHYRSIFTDTTWRNPDGQSIFWQTLQLQNLIPNCTATHPSVVLIFVWLIALIIVSAVLYPRTKSIP